MEKLLKYLFILQEVSNEDRSPKLGRGHFNARRFNPYNPLSYLAVIIIIIVGLILFGVIGFWKETDGKNPFKWD